MSGTMRRAWGPSDDDRLRQLFLVGGRSLEAIAIAEGRTLPSVRTRLSRLGMCPGYSKHAAAMDLQGELAVRERKNSGRNLVRCLGVGSLEQEHRFASPDPTRIRVCQACRRRMECLE